MVIEGSPAAEAGIESGDRLVAIDGRAARERTLGEIRDMFRKDGQQYALEFRRGETFIRAGLRTRRLL
jgi:C-terminal processing protease CtpA/Prc